MRIAAVFVSAFLLSACGPLPGNTPESTAQFLCDALVDNDAENYQRYTVTSADFILRDEGLTSPFKQQMSYAGKVLKPEEIARQQEEFRRAAGQLSGLSCRDVQSRGSESRERLDGGMIEVSLFAAVTKQGPLEAPLFEIVRWGSEYRLLGLQFPDEKAAALDPEVQTQMTAEMP